MWSPDHSNVRGPSSVQNTFDTEKVTQHKLEEFAVENFKCNKVSCTLWVPSLAEDGSHYITRYCRPIAVVGA